MKCHCGLMWSFYLMSDGSKVLYCVRCDRGYGFCLGSGRAVCK